MTDIDSPSLAGATVAITSSFAAGQDVLGFTNQLGITGATTPATGVLDPHRAAAGGELPDRAAHRDLYQQQRQPEHRDADVTFTANDGTTPSAGATKTITVTAETMRPVLAQPDGRRWATP